jgi:predicted dehydrogenase
MIKIGVIGCGYWGPNIIRNFNALPNCQVAGVCDSNPVTLKKILKLAPSAATYTQAMELINSPTIDAIAVVTPVSTHFDLAKKALLNGKHVFVEKPFTATVDQAAELIDIAQKKNLQIMVDHTFLFTGAVRKIKEMIDQEMLGTIYYYDSTRLNLGLFQHDVNVIWDLAPHDFSIMLHVLGEKPTAVSACGAKHINEMVNVAYVTVHFDSPLIAHFNVNWLSPVKVRNTLIGGEKKMLLWNDVIADDKIKVYDKGVEVKDKEDINKLLVSYRSGDMHSPKLDQREALSLECEYFLECLEQNKKPINDGTIGLDVVKLLAACDESLNNQGRQIKLH